MSFKTLVQTRDFQGQLQYFETIKEAFSEAEKNESIWKISVALPNGERVRLIREEKDGEFFYEDIMTEVTKLL